MSTSRGETRLWSLLTQAGTVQTLEESAPVPALQDHTLWEYDFGRWVIDCCRFYDRSSGGVKPLHRHFCEWALAHQLVPCMLETWEALLESEGFRMRGGLVYGLVLKEDGEPWPQKLAPPATIEVKRELTLATSISRARERVGK